ncbi:hypothetical protein niasHT_039477 [Heterodera trifolii]|uniref:Galectin domain-containing protein n=1 Tax=Heterodera trifolii TaxID=157864 RepID=A0ABD2IMB4_9BILA
MSLLLNLATFTIFAIVLAVPMFQSFAGVQSFANDDNASSLTGESMKKHFTKEYNALDQCTKTEVDQKIGSFSLSFKIIGECFKGMLFCYPGSLEQSGSLYNYGMTVGMQYNVKNQPNNSVATECEEKHRLLCLSEKKEERRLCMESTVWHGIRISGPFNGSKFHLEMSIAKEKYEFEKPKHRNELKIIFGNRHNLLTLLIDELGNQIEFLNHNDDKIRDAFIAKKAHKATKLRDHVGLWMLGLDLLPMLSRRTMHLHAYRGCSCNMHAWFHSPHEKLVSHEMYGVPPIPTECAVAQDKEFEFQLEPIKIGNSLNVSFRLEKNANFVLIRLWDKKRSLIFAMEMTKNGTKLEPSNELIDCGNTRFMKASHKIKVQIVVQKFLYEINVNGKKCANYFPWPNDWMESDRRTERIKSVTLKGDIYTETIGVRQNNTEVLGRRNKWKDYNITTRFNKLPSGAPFELFINLKNDNDQNEQPLLETIEVNLTTSKKIGRNVVTSFELENDFLKKHFVTTIGVEGDVILFAEPKAKQIVNPRRKMKKRIRNEPKPTLFKLPPNSICGFGATCSHTEQKSKLFAGEQFTIRISVEQSQFNIDIHGARVASFMPSIKMATWAGNVLGIVGDLKEKPTVKVNRAKINRTAQKRGTQFVLKVPDEDRKARNKTIQILGEIVKPDFTINFLYGALEENPIGINVLKMIFSSFGLNSKLLDKEEKDELTSSIKSGKRLNLTLTIRGRQIKSYLNNIEIFDEQTTLPYWAIQYIQIDGVKAQKGGGKLVTIENEAKSLEGLLTSLIF